MKMYTFISKQNFVRIVRYCVCAYAIISFSAFGFSIHNFIPEASFVYLNKEGETHTPFVTQYLGEGGETVRSTQKNLLSISYADIKFYLKPYKGAVFTMKHNERDIHV